MDSFYYRGENNNYKLLPSVFRNKYLKYESYFFHEMMKQRPQSFRDNDNFYNLVTMQHYGCPTRLLDITSNPLIALFFACNGYKTNNKSKGKIYVFNFSESFFNSFEDSDKVTILSSLAKLSYKDQQAIHKEASEHINEVTFLIKNGEYTNDTVEHLYLEITLVKPTFKRQIKPIDVLRPILVKPNYSNSRILLQNGAFIINGLSKSIYDAQAKLRFLSPLELTIVNQKQILKSLDDIGINEASLFFELENVANYLKNKISK